MAIEAYACQGPAAPLERFTYEPADLKPLEVEIEITHCGICHSDVHLLNNEWGLNQYPLVPGHEIVGHIRERGRDVTGLEIGQRVGVGWQRGACLSCEYCEQGEENLCTRMDATCVGHYGGFARAIRVDSRFVFPLPDALESPLAAPLLCAGVTVFAPLRRYGTGPGKRVGVLGVGGLGHLAIQFARAMGAEVVAISSTAEKERDARELGASQFIDARDTVRIKKANRTLDLLLNTVSVGIDYPDYLGMVRPGGVMCVVGAPRDPIVLRPGMLIGGQKAIAGSSIGGTRAMREMLAFAVEHGIRPRVTVLPMEQCNLAVAKVAKNQARYRIVLQN
ncbi:MAG TPA: NAD(P)-dependent alcohol dehydrogenase [Gammaproteobacteria bacterium]|nr:NAD(P)-dependent alcohol dehydrogenase [Gammaproteobacteria bacterium]